MRVIFACVALLMATPDVAGAMASPHSQTVGDYDARIKSLTQRVIDMGSRMGREIGQAANAAGGDDVRLQADLDTIQLRYQPEANAFAAELDAIESSRIATLRPAEQVAAWASHNAGVANLRNTPASVRAAFLQAGSAQNP